MLWIIPENEHAAVALDDAAQTKNPANRLCPCCLYSTYEAVKVLVIWSKKTCFFTPVLSKNNHLKNSKNVFKPVFRILSQSHTRAATDNLRQAVKILVTHYAANALIYRPLSPAAAQTG